MLIMEMSLLSKNANKQQILAKTYTQITVL